MSFCSFLPTDPHSSISPKLDRSFLLNNHTTQGLIHPDTQTRCTYTYTPSSSHSLTLLAHLPDHRSSLLLLGNLECWRMGSGFRVANRKDSSGFHLLSLKFRLVGLRCNSVLHYPNDRYSCRYN